MVIRTMVFLLLLPVSSFGGELIKEATILEVASNATSTGTPTFGIKTEGGTGVCTGSSWIFFPENVVPNNIAYNQSFTIALAALAAGKKVRVHNYANDSCNHANFISISR